MIASSAGASAGASGGAFSVSISPSPNDKSTAAGSPSGTVTSDNMTATPSGGTAPYTYSWAKVGGAGSPSFSAATSATTNVGLTVNASAERTLIIRCTVTDNAAAVAYRDVSVTLENTTP